MQDNETRTELLNARIYRDEPIFREAFAEASLIPPQYRRMRELTRNDSLYGRSEAEIFYRQGKFMEKFEDDFDEPGEFLRYFPTYQAMTDRQLRSYFSWRSRLRRGILEPTSLSFVFVYLYALSSRSSTAIFRSGSATTSSTMTLTTHSSPISRRRSSIGQC